ncbi:MAG: hypothetical protein GY931_04260 [Maribacter sp.]|nr:hypothetical protein [Maribacter sp.]
MRKVTIEYCNDDFLYNCFTVKISKPFDGHDILKFDRLTEKLYWYYENTLRGRSERIDAPDEIVKIFNEQIDKVLKSTPFL